MDGSRAPVLAVCSFTPFPLFDGDSVRVFGLLRALSACVRLTLWCVESDGGDVSGLRSALPEVEIRAFPRDHARDTSLVAKLTRYGRASVRGIPAWILKSGSSELADELPRWADEWDGVLALGEASAQQVCGSARPWHWDKFNVQSVSLAEDFRWLRNPAATLRDYANLNAARRYERARAVRARSVSVTNRDEAARYMRLFGGSPIVVHSSIPLPEYVREPEPGRLLWLGNFGYSSNRDGLDRFLTTCWPHLQATFTLRLVGAGLTAQDSARYGRLPNVDPVGLVEDLQEELVRAHLGVVPLWSGGGTKIKTLTMMAAGLPVVSTLVGVEGVPRGESAEFYLAAGAEDLTRAISQAAGDADAEAVGRRGRERIRRDFTEEGLADQYARLVAEVLGRQA